MKKLIFYFVGIIVLSAWTAAGQSIKKQRGPAPENTFKICHIDSVQTVYIIYAKRNDSIIKIVSKKESVDDCRPIQKGAFYDLKISSLLEHTAGKRHIGGVKYNDLLIMLDGNLNGNKVVWDLFICENLKGLCYLTQTEK